HNTVEFTGVNQVIPIPNGASLNAYHNLIINGTGAIMPSTTNIVGNLTINQPVNFAGKTVAMNSTEPQVVGGTANPIFDNFIINNLGDVSLGTDVSVTGTLTMNGGNLTLNNSNLTVGPNPLIGSFSTSSMIITN